MHIIVDGAASIYARS